MKILFVCLGNICRSPMAECIMNDLLQKNGFAPCCASAATSREEEGNPMYPPARRMLLSHGISPKPGLARVLCPQDYEAYDLLIGMDRRNIRDMQRLFGGDPQKKIRSLLSFCGQEADVADPWFTGDFTAAWEDISRGCEAILRQLFL